jgi:cyanophycin synthetase
MEFRRIRALRGPNIWAYSPVLEAYIDLKEWKDTSSAMVPGFTDRLMAWLPSLIEHECSEEHRGGFLVRLNEGTYPAHILEHVALELQCLAGAPVGYGRARGTPEEGVYRIVIKYKVEEVAREALEIGRTLILANLQGQDFDVDSALRQLRGLVVKHGLGAAAAAVMDAAKERSIPVQRVGDYSVLFLGQGARQRRYWGVETDHTSAVASSIAKDKQLTRFLLKAVGAPAAAGQLVESAEEAWEVAQELGLPVVIKPNDGNRGRAVSLNLAREDEVRAAFKEAREISSYVVIERFEKGDAYRFLVIGGRLAAASRRDPADFVGDGKSTVLKLIETNNADPRRGDDHNTPLRRLTLDAEARDVLAEQGLQADSIPKAGERVRLVDNLTPGMEAAFADVTDLVHPEVAACAVRAARAVGLDVAGLDVVARDISLPPEQGGMTIVEVNSGPGLKLHLAPDEGSPRPVALAIVDSLFPDGDNGRIPVAAITGVNGKTTVTRLIAHIVRGTGKCVGLTCTDGIYIGDRRIESGDCAGPKSARNVLLNPEVEAAVLEAARGGILREGLGFDRCQVGVVTNIGSGDHLGIDYILTPEDLVRVKGLIAEVVLPGGWAVLNAADPLVAGMIDRTRGCGVIYFARDGQNSVILAHREKGGRAAFERDGAIVLAEGPKERVLTTLKHVPLTRGGRIGFQVENAITAAAAAWGLDIDDATIVAGLSSFDSEPGVTPGRFNVMDMSDSTVIVDFGHNPSALEALVETLKGFEGKRRSVVYAAVGDRGDDVIVRQAEILAAAFDRIMLYQEPHLDRGRPPGEILALLHQGFDTSPRVPEVDEFNTEHDAIVHAFDTLLPGDLLVLLVDAVDSSLALVRKLLDDRAQAAPTDKLR